MDDHKIYYEGIDYLTIKMPNNAPIINDLQKMEIGDSYKLGFANLTIKYAGLIAGSQLKVYYINNGEWTAKGELQQIACVHIYQENIKQNKNFNTDIELVGRFWNFYKQHADDFYKYFGIDVHKRDLLTRCDYCFDITNFSVDDIFKLLKKDFGKVKDKDHYEFDLDSETYQKQKVWFRLKGNRHDIAVYDKKYQIIDEQKYKEKINGKQVYKHYIENDFKITRIEYRKNARGFKDFENNSIEETLKRMRNMAISHIKKLFDLDISLLINDYEPTIRFKADKIDHMNIGFAHKKGKLYLSRGLSYINNFALLKSEKELFRHLDNIYGQRIRHHFLKDFIDSKKQLFEAKKVFGQVY